MSNANENKGSKGNQSNRPILIGALVVIIMIVGYVFATGGDDSQASARYFKVTQNDFLVSITEGGNLEAVNEVIIRNEVEGSSRIVYIVPEGSPLLISKSSEKGNEPSKFARQKSLFSKRKRPSCWRKTNWNGQRNSSTKDSRQRAPSTEAT